MTLPDVRRGRSSLDEPADRGETRPTLLDLAPAWITLREAAYASRASQDAIRAWVEAGMVARVSLLPDDDPLGLFLRTADIQAALRSRERLAAAEAIGPLPREIQERPRSPWEVSRRKVLVGLGAALAGGLVPVGALADGKHLSLARDGNTARIFAGAFSTARSATLEADTADATSGQASIGTVATQTDADGAAGGKATVIRSVTVEPDPVQVNGEALISINASPKGRIVSYAITASDGVLAQDPRSPWVWTWRAA